MADPIPVLCTLAKHHEGGHDERGRASRSACRKIIRYEDPPIDPADMPPPSGPAGTPEELDDPVAHAETPEQRVQRVAEEATMASLSKFVPEPTTADLVSNVLGALADVDLSRAELDAAEKRANRAGIALQENIGRGALVHVGGVLHRSVLPRKPKGGELPADALWSLVPVEVKG